MQPLTVIADTKEQKPWTFSDRIRVVRRHLTTGDYSLEGLEDRVAIERKSLGDAVQTFIHDWLRFRKELIRLSAFDVAIVVIEATLDDVLQHRYESDANPESILGRANAIMLDHGIPVCWWGPRAAAVHMAERFLLLAGNKLGA